jgi:hypothetical protein
MAELNDGEIRERYAAAAAAIADAARSRCGGESAGPSCCAPAVRIEDANGGKLVGGSPYATGSDGAPVEASLGCGAPTAVAELRGGDTILDLGAGADALISAQRVGRGPRSWAAGRPS